MDQPWLAFYEPLVTGLNLIPDGYVEFSTPSGIVASFVLGISRAVGETMAVSLACGDKPRLTFDPREGIATMTSFIVRIAQGDVQHGSTDFNSLFAVAGVLFIMTLTMNIFAQWTLQRFRQVYQ